MLQSYAMELAIVAKQERRAQRELVTLGDQLWRIESQAESQAYNRRELFDDVSRLSGPLLDRFDLRVPVERPAVDDMFDGEPGESTAEVAARVARARSISTSSLGQNRVVWFRSTTRS